MGSVSGTQTLAPAAREGPKGGPACGWACTLRVRLIPVHWSLKFRWKLESFCFGMATWRLQESSARARLGSAPAFSRGAAQGRLTGLGAQGEARLLAS